MFIKYLFFFSPFFSFFMENSDERARHTHQIVKAYAIEMEKKGLEFGGIGEGVNHDTLKQNYLSVTLYADVITDIDYARKLFIEAHKTLVNHVNSSVEYRPYIDMFPFPSDKLEICIFSRNCDKGLSRVNNFRNKISYCKHDVLDPGYRTKEFFHETFEEAVAILKQETK